MIIQTYTLTCLKCKKSYKSKYVYPKIQLCPSCGHEIDQEQEFRRQLSGLLWNPPKTDYASSRGGTYLDTDYMQQEENIWKLIEKFLPELARDKGYVKLAADQIYPEVLVIGKLTEKELVEAVRESDYEAGFRRVIPEGK